MRFILNMNRASLFTGLGPSVFPGTERTGTERSGSETPPRNGPGVKVQLGLSPAAPEER